MTTVINDVMHLMLMTDAMKELRQCYDTLM